MSIEVGSFRSIRLTEILPSGIFAVGVAQLVLEVQVRSLRPQALRRMQSYQTNWKFLVSECSGNVPYTAA